MKSIPPVGEVAPDFKALALHDGKQVEIVLSSLRGQWVVLMFYPGDFTCVCPTELAIAAVKYPAFRDLGAELLAVSTDSTEVHRNFQEMELSRVVSGGARFPLISDPSGTVGSLYGFFDASQNVERRGHFLINPEGIIQSLEMLASPLGRSVSEILRQLRALKEHGVSGRMTPCGWEPGKPVLSAVDESGNAIRPWASWKPRDAF